MLLTIPEEICLALIMIERFQNLGLDSQLTFFSA